MGSVCSRLALQVFSLRNTAPRVPARADTRDELAVRLRFTSEAEDLIFVHLPSLVRTLGLAAMLLAGGATLAGMICLLMPR